MTNKLKRWCSIAICGASACAAGKPIGGDPTGSGSDSGSGMGPATDVVDDLEDGDGSILMHGMRVGAWYTYDDGTAGGARTFPPGTGFKPAAPGANSSRFAARLAYTGFTTWGAGLGFNLDDPGDGAGGSHEAPYDASAYTGLTFLAKAASAMTLRVNLPDAQTDPAGGTCAAGCNDDFGADVSLGTDWQPVTIMFASASQIGWSGIPLTALDASTLFAVHFQAGAGDFDFWIDDVALLH